jgi:hypothetical protein
MGRRDIIVVALGLLVATVLTIVATVYVVDNYLAPFDPSDPLTKQGGLKPGQDIHKK